MTLLETLRSSPCNYTVLREKHGPTTDFLLRLHLKRGEIIKVSRGTGHLYALPPPPVPDEPLKTPKKPCPKGRRECRRCHEVKAINRFQPNENGGRRWVCMQCKYWSSKQGILAKQRRGE